MSDHESARPPAPSPEPSAAPDEGESILAMPRSTLAVWLVGFVIASVVSVWYVAPPEWGVLEIGVGGVVLGIMSFYMLFINRLLVS
ncbi:MAG: hypothetical protein ABMA64_20725 [Myxococcota bacterium]